MKVTEEEALTYFKYKMTAWGHKAIPQAIEIKDEIVEIYFSLEEDIDSVHTFTVWIENNELYGEW